LIEHLKVLAGERLRWGWRRLLIMLRRDGWSIGERAFRRIYRALALHVTRVRKRHVRYVRGTALEPVSGPNERWSLDFMHARTVYGRAYRLLNVIDDFTREVLAIAPQFSFGSSDVIRVLEDIAFGRGLPATLRFDNGSEFSSQRNVRWAADKAVRLHFIQPGKPTQNGKIESLNGRVRDELLNPNLFRSIDEGTERRASLARRLQHRPPALEPRLLDAGGVRCHPYATRTLTVLSDEESALRSKRATATEMRALLSSGSVRLFACVQRCVDLAITGRPSACADDGAKLPLWSPEGLDKVSARRYSGYPADAAVLSRRHFPCGVRDGREPRARGRFIFGSRRRAVGRVWWRRRRRFRASDALASHFGTHPRGYRAPDERSGVVRKRDDVRRERRLGERERRPGRRLQRWHHPVQRDDQCDSVAQPLELATRGQSILAKRTTSPENHRRVGTLGNRVRHAVFER